MAIRKKKFGIPIKLSLMVILIIVISFLFIFSFFQKTQREELRRKMQDELALKLDNIKQDIINYAFQLETGDFRLAELQKKITSLYESGFGADSQLAVFREIAFLNKNGQIVAHNNPELKMKSFLALEKRRLSSSDYQKLLESWTRVNLQVTDRPEVSFLKRKNESIYQLIQPLYYDYKNIRGFNRTQLFFDLWQTYEKGDILKNIQLSNFFLRTFQLFSLFWENRIYMNKDGKITEEGEKILEFFRKPRFRFRRRTQTTSFPYRITEGDFDNIEKTLEGFYYYAQEYWYKRIREGERILEAARVMEEAVQKGLFDQKTREIQSILMENQKTAYEEWQGQFIVAVLQLKKIYQSSLESFQHLLPEDKREIFQFFENIFEMPGRLENLSDNPESLQRYIRRKLKVMDWWSQNIQKNLTYLRNLLADYLEVNLKEEDRVFSKDFLIRSLRSLYRIKAFQAFQADPERFGTHHQLLEMERMKWERMIWENEVLYYPISLMKQRDDHFSLKYKRNLFSFYFFLYLHQFLGVFQENSGKLTSSIQSVVETNIPEEYKNFKKRDILVLEEKIRFLRKLLLKFKVGTEMETGSLENIFRIEGQFLTFQPAFVQDLFQSLIQRYLIGYLVVRVSEEKIRLAIDKQTNSLIDLGINLLIRFVFLAVLFSLFFLKKFRLLFQGVEWVGQGNLDYKIRIPGSDEFGQLADHFNRMTGNLKKAQGELVEKSRMEEELKIAQRIQATLLPKTYPEYPSLSFASYYNAQTETGGDYFDFIKLDEKSLGLVIADVSGHGVGACLVMSMIRTLLRSYAFQTRDPKKLLMWINDYVYSDTPSNMYATIFYGVYNMEKRELIYSIGGHNAGIIFNPSSGEIRTLQTGGMTAGIVPTTVFGNVVKNYREILSPGEIFFQYTDGVTEAMDQEQNEYGMERLIKGIKESGAKEVNELFERIIQDIQQFTQGYIQSDDITMMGMQVSKEEGK